MFYLAFLLVVSCILISALVVFLDKEVPLFSLRNVFLLGFLYFQAFGMFSWLFDRESNSWWAYLVNDRNYSTSVTYGVMLNTFVIVFLFVYKIVTPKTKPYVPQTDLRPEQYMTLAFWMTGAALAVWLVGYIGLKDLMRFAATGIGVSAVGFATWAWCFKIKDPAYIALVVVIAALNLVPQLTDFGRRGIVSVAGIVAWVVYYRVSFKFNPVKLATITAILVVPLVVVLAAFSEARVRRPESTREAVELMVNADIGKGVSRIATFQGSAPISMWLMENHPEPFEYRHCYSLQAYFWFFVPRSIWRDKPAGLGISVPRMANLKGVGGLNVGAGMIGHASSEGGWYALVLYAIALAIPLKFLDQIVLYKVSAFYRVPLAASLAELFATARGEVNFFLDIMTICIVMGLLTTFTLSRLLFGKRKF
jgi:hypothetical protein